MREWGYSSMHSSALDVGEWVSFMHQLLYLQGKSSQYLLDRRWGGPQSQSGCIGE
jgi:hypothetical protein